LAARTVRVPLTTGVLILRPPDTSTACERHAGGARSCTVERGSVYGATFGPDGPGASWSVPLVLAGDQIEVARVEGQILLLAYSSLATSAEIVSLRETTGAETWRRWLPGRTLYHSAYRNEVLMELTAGQIVVWGNESAGRYVETLDVGDGHAVCERIELDP
jgi:hypothetical protein